MRIVALVESEDHVCCRYRISAFREDFAAAGHELQILPIPSGPLGRLTIGRGFGQADAVILQRKLLPSWTVALLRRRTSRLIFDFDDAVWLRDSYSSRGFDDPRRRRRFRAIVRACDLVVAGNDFLAAAAGGQASSDRVHVIPTCVDPKRYPTSSHDNRPPRMVWIGSSSTLQGLERFRATLSAVGRAIHGIRLKLICDRFLAIPELAVDPCPWKEATEASDIAAADIGISWVPDDPWSRGKCGLKILQYQAAGLPVIANPVGVHPEMVHDGTGILASSPEEWVAAAVRLAAEAELRRRMGAAGRLQLETRYSVAAGARRWLEILNSMR